MPGQPILIGGCGRSGTTLTLSVLASHPEIYSFHHETEVFSYRPFNFEKLELKHAVLPHQKRWLEKTPSNCRNYKEIDELFGGKVKFINMVRDGRDVIVSEYYGTKTKYFISPERWVVDVNCGLEMEGCDNFLTVRYEDLVTSFVPTVNRICDFLEIEDRKTLLAFPKYTPIVKNAGWKDLFVRPPFTDSIGNWKKSAHDHQVRKLLEMRGTAKLFKFYGYE